MYMHTLLKLPSHGLIIVADSVCHQVCSKWAECSEEISSS